MSEESLFAIKMAKMSDAELKNHIANKDDYQDFAILTAVLELEKRGIPVENGEEIKQELIASETTKKETVDSSKQENNSFSNQSTALYSTKSIFIFGALFSVFGGGILMALNLFQLNKKNNAFYVIIGSVVYSFILNYVYSFLNLTEKVAISNFTSIDAIFTAILISVVSSLTGVYFLYELFWKKEIPSTTNYRNKSIWKPVVIILLINLVSALILLGSGDFPLK
ncbi:hypothetical protein [Lutibacter flavus]|uniref:Uncharacterized protein n=1 Tax=Lutibacter flavus TaxID=691689 RepID=A0A238X496_9FLAO|nr:hypothetical protein [Lutibacter flavus]SNR53757.1 hypothetical protein SAMN04488111_1562 [Lutibacter flavus]